VTFIEKTNKNFHSEKNGTFSLDLDPDPQLDPDPHLSKRLDPDPHVMYAHPKQWFLYFSLEVVVKKCFFFR
jgi:hypothetical protein